MRLLLTSNGFPRENRKARQKLLALTQKPANSLRVCFIPTASAVEIDRTFSSIDRQELEELGIPSEQITTVELDHEINQDELRAFDIIYVDGGNSFYLLQQALLSKFDRAIRSYLEHNIGVYVGVSAGTLLAGPDIEIAEPWDDRTKADLCSTTGLGLVSTVYCPHYLPSEEKILFDYQKQAAYPIEPLRDGQAICITGKTIEWIDDTRV